MKRLLIFSGLLFLIALGWRMFFTSGPAIRNQGATGPIVSFGDSLTSGYGSSTGMDYPAQLARLIGRPVINAGKPGDTTESALKRLERDVLSLAPGLVFITLGGNDLKNGVARDTAFANLTAIIEAIQAEGALVVVGGIRMAVWDRGYGNAYRQVCDRTGAVLVEDILGRIMGNSELMSDSIHPNDAGYRIMAERFYEAARPYL